VEEVEKVTDLTVKSTCKEESRYVSLALNAVSESISLQRIKLLKNGNFSSGVTILTHAICVLPIYATD